MSQFNMHVTPEFEERLERYRRIKGFRTKAEAIRAAIEEGLARALTEARPPDFTSWIGLGRKAPQNRRVRFPTDDALWEKDR